MSIARREFLAGGAAGLLVGVFFNAPLARAAQLAVPGSATPAAGDPPTQAWAPNAWVQVAPNGDIYIWVGKSEMGQGVRTALPQILADEMDADWSRVRVEQAPTLPKFGPMGTGGSTSVMGSWDPLRKAGAQARLALIGAAAQRWRVKPGECSTFNSYVIHSASGKRLSYGELAEEAARQPLEESPALKGAAQRTLVGKSLDRVDGPAIVAGKAQYGIDVRRPNMVFAALERWPVVEAELLSYNDSAARRIPGVLQTVKLPHAVAVIATNTWAAFEGQRALKVRWNPGPRALQSTGSIFALMHQSVRQPGNVARDEGNEEGAFQAASKKVEAVYETPFLAHVAMEPMNCTAEVSNGHCTLWAPTQNPTRVQMDVAKALDISPDKVLVNVTLMGGGFGRRLESDYGVEAALVARALGRPVQVIWTREDDVRHDAFRPPTVHALRAGIDGSGQVVSWRHRVSSPTPAAQDKKHFDARKLEGSVVDGASDVHYRIPAIRIEQSTHEDLPVRVGWLRGVYPNQNGFANEVFVDELAAAAGQDPFEFRRGLLAGDEPIDTGHGKLYPARLRRVLELAAERAGWGTPPPKGRARGISCTVLDWAHTYVSQVAEVSLENQLPRVHRIVAVIDCGTVVNPELARMQAESAIIFGLSMTFDQAVTIRNGEPQQHNFYDFPVLRMPQAPLIEIHFAPGSDRPGGLGEPPVAGVSPAVFNALFALTGKRLRRLPITAEDFQG